MKAIKIYKVGGAVLAESSGFYRFISLVKSEISPAVFVISALGLTTRELKNAALIAQDKDFNLAKTALEKIFKKHLKFVEKTIPNDLPLIKINFKPIKNKALKLIRGIALTGFLSNKTLDAVLSIGEELALAIISAHFNNNENILIVDSSELIVTDDNFNNANPILEQCKAKIENYIPILKQNKRIITQGFVARSINGFITTMGLESSNLTATILADILNVYELRIQTNVAGIYHADPKKYDSTSLIKSMSYDFAKSSAMNGLKLIYGDMIDIAKKKSIKIIYESGLNSDNTGTIIEEIGESDVPLIISQANTSLIRIHFNSYNERKILIDNLLNDTNNRSKVVYSALMEDYVELIMNNSATDLLSKFTAIEIYQSITLVKILNSHNIPNINYLIEKYKKLIISGLLFINSDNNIRLLIKDDNANNFINEIIELNYLTN